MEARRLAPYLIPVAAAAGVLVGASMLGGRNESTHARDSSQLEAAIGSLVNVIADLRTSIDAMDDRTGQELAPVGPRSASRESGDQADMLTRLVDAVERLEGRLAGGHLQISGGGGATGRERSQPLLNARGLDVRSVQEFVSNVLEEGKASMPLHMSVYGLADYIELFGEPTYFGVSKDGVYGLDYRLNPSDSADRRTLVVRCLLDRTIELRYSAR